MKKIKTVLVANRGEIAIRVFRACNELGIRTVAIYSKEDTLSLHRNRADEAYLVGEGKGPIDAYLDIEDIMRIAREHDVDAIHPGYGFLSENSQLAKRCAEEGFIFIGPCLEHLIMFGDKINARTQAELAGIPMIPGSTGTVSSVEEVRAFAGKHGFPIIIKAVNGGGGRGMRMVASMDELDQAYSLAKSEALKAFGSDEIYLEKYLQNPKHIEVQIIGDTHGNIVHLHERDCSVQRRHQKLVEVAPAFSLPQQLRSRICEAAVKLMKNVDYISAGTVEFLATPDNNFYFIEVNPRIQVEHTVTEEITGIDIVQTQIKIAEGYSIHDPEIAIPEQKDIITHGHSLIIPSVTCQTGMVIEYQSFRIIILRDYCLVIGYIKTDTITESAFQLILPIDGQLPTTITESRIIDLRTVIRTNTSEIRNSFSRSNHVARGTLINIGSNRQSVIQQHQVDT